MSNDGFNLAQHAETFKTHSLATGIAPSVKSFSERSVTEKEKVEIWFIDPLNRMKGDEGFVCLMVCFPLIETMIRYELEIADDVNFAFSDGSPALKWVAEFLTIPEVKAKEVWDSLRNGMLHRGMIKNETVYCLSGEMPGRTAEFRGDVLNVFVWELRDNVVKLLRKYHRRLWADSGCRLPRILISK